jgi:hypothetical protein
MKRWHIIWISSTVESIWTFTLCYPWFSRDKAHTWYLDVLGAFFSFVGRAWRCTRNGCPVLCNHWPETCEAQEAQFAPKYFFTRMFHQKSSFSSNDLPRPGTTFHFDPLAPSCGAKISLTLDQELFWKYPLDVRVHAHAFFGSLANDPFMCNNDQRPSKKISAVLTRHQFSSVRWFGFYISKNDVGIPLPIHGSLVRNKLTSAEFLRILQLLVHCSRFCWPGFSLFKIALKTTAKQCKTP